ncbi:cytochrome P450 [Mycena olivaceomarginata]|nr:cytochrome P450 [Mycena olivaceomarginata]
MIATSLTSIAVAGIGAAVFNHLFRYISYSLSPRGKLPIAPKNEASWWLGHEYLVARNEVGVEFGRWTRLLGPVFRIKSALCQADTVVISDPLAVKHIFGQVYTYIKSPAFQPIVIKFVGRGVIWAEGDEHKFQRRMISPVFSTSAVKKMAPGVMTCVDKLIVRLQSDCKSKGVFNMCDYIPAVTLEVIGRVGFGYDFGPESPEGGIAPWIANLPIDALQDGVAKKLIHKVGRKMLRDPPNMDGTDMFSILVRESWEGKKNPNGERRLDDATLLDNILSFFMAGFETTSGTIHLILLDLAQNPDVQTKLREEILAADSSEVDVIEALPYLDAVTREGLRLHPSVRDTHRVAVHDDVIPLKRPVTLSSGKIITSLPVEAGDSFIIPFTGLNTNPDVWGPDAALFIPERWLEGGSIPDSEDLPHGPWGNISTFADGPRHCIGWRLAVQEIKLIVGALVKTSSSKTLAQRLKNTSRRPCSLSWMGKRLTFRLN